jgi:hypothetical protein
MAEPDLSEEALKSADQHVAEGRELIARQQDFVKRLEQDGHKEFAEVARAMLRDMEQLQREMEERAILQRQLAEDRRGTAQRENNTPEAKPT